MKLDVVRRLMLQVLGSTVTPDTGLLVYCELDHLLGLTTAASDVSAGARTGKGGRHVLAGLFRQSVFGRPAGYEDVSHAERLHHDPVLRGVVDGEAASGTAALPGQIGRFETRWLLPRKTSRRSLIFWANGSIT